MGFVASYLLAFCCNSYCATIISLSPHMYIYTHKCTPHSSRKIEKYLLNKARTLVADGIHQVHFTIGGNSSGFAGNRRKEINCSNLSTSCLNLFCEILNQTYCIYSHVIAVHARVCSIKCQCYLIKTHAFVLYIKTKFQI